MVFCLLIYLHNIEIEWAPEGLDLDFSAFGSSTHEIYSSHQEQMKEVHIDLEEAPVKSRRFLTEQEDTAELVETQDSLASSAEPVIDHDTSTIEYAPTRELGRKILVKMV